MKKFINTALVAGIQILVIVLAALAFNVAEPAKAHAAARAWQPCANDEPVGGPCIWDGRHMGNGIGNSLLIRKSGRVIRITHERAHRLLGL